MTLTIRKTARTAYPWVVRWRPRLQAARTRYFPTRAQAEAFRRAFVARPTPREEIARIGEGLVQIAAAAEAIPTAPLGDLMTRLALVYGRIETERGGLR